MRFPCGACLAAASVVALATTSQAANKKDKDKKEAERLKTAPFNVVLVIFPDGTKSIEAIEPMKMRDRQKELMQAFASEMQLWRESRAVFKKSPENRGREFEEPAPVPPNLKVMQSRIRGKEQADEAVKVLSEKWLKPLLEKEQARAKAAAEEAARKDPRKNPDFLPKGNQLMNGGFEERDSKNDLADGWTGGQWGGPGKKYSVRRSKMNPREGGEYSVVLYSMSEGAKPGVSAAVKLPPAKYEIRYWACADAGKTARIQVSFGGEDLQDHPVTDKWQQFTDRVTVEKRSFQTKLQIWTATSRVRVYLDDVELEACK